MGDKIKYKSLKIIKGFSVGTIKTKRVWKLIMELDDGDFKFILSLKDVLQENNKRIYVESKNSNERVINHSSLRRVFF